MATVAVECRQQRACMATSLVPRSCTYQDSDAVEEFSLAAMGKVGFIIPCMSQGVAARRSLGNEFSSKRNTQTRSSSRKLAFKTCCSRFRCAVFFSHSHDILMWESYGTERSYSKLWTLAYRCVWPAMRLSAIMWN